MAAVLIWSMTGLLAVASVLPLSKVAHGAIRGLAFPRAQFFVLGVLLLLAAQVQLTGAALVWVSLVLVAVCLLQCLYIVKFTPFWGKQSIRASAAQEADASARVSLLASNVKMSNRSYDRLIRLIRERDPDIAMAIEVDTSWLEALKGALEPMYPYWIEAPQDNGYGLCVMSKLPLSQTAVRDLITADVPSVRTAVELRNGDRFRLYVVHPEPPVIDHDTLGRDCEIAKVGLEASQDPLPAVVAGDLNDVAWSTTTRRFQRLSHLLDPRVGRGFYNTFSATMPWMRWPLDHLFHDAQFRFVDMARLEKIGSDHFPMWFVLHLAESRRHDVPPGDASAEEHASTKDMIEKERTRDRDAIGTEWEQDAEGK